MRTDSKSGKLFDKKSLKYLYCLEFLLIAALGVFIGLHHESWSDEAQSWLIARDTSWAGLFGICKYEGTPPLWYFVIKAFIACGLKYDFFFVISLAATLIGVFLLLFLADAGNYVKILFPFAIIPLYQNIAVSRSYSLVFPIIMLIVLSFDKKQEKPLRYFLSVFLLSMTSSYGIIMAGSFLLTDTFNLLTFFRNKEIKEKRKYALGYLLCGIGVLLAAYLIIPAADASFGMSHSDRTIFDHITAAFLFISPNQIVSVVSSVLLVIFFVYYAVKSKKLLRCIILVLPISLYIVFFYGNNWHYTNWFFMAMAAMLIYKPDEEQTSKRETVFIKSVIALILCSQIALSVVCIQKDYFGDYSGSKKAAQIISEYVEDGKTVYAADFYSTAIQPYFSENIYINHPEKSGYYFWSEENGYNESKHLDKVVKTVGKEPDVIVSYDYEFPFDGYERYSCDGTLYYKNSEAKDSALSVWIKK